MSQLSVLFHKHSGEVFRNVIEHLETVDLPSSVKQSIAVAVMKAIHVGQGGTWSPQLEAGVIGAIDFVLGEIRGWAKSQDGGSTTAPPATPPGTGGSIYGNTENPPVPDGAALHQQGFKSGDVVWGYYSPAGSLVHYTIVQPGSVPPITLADGSKVGDVPLLTL